MSCGCQDKSTARRGPFARRRPTRPNCLECVEKHLGAAWVLITEHQNGYPYRLLAIGHLHEAEEESQEWPQLHDAIREARTTYQKKRACPEFEHLSALVQAEGRGRVAGKSG